MLVLSKRGVALVTGETSVLDVTVGVGETSSLSVVLGVAIVTYYSTVNLRLTVYRLSFIFFRA